MDQRRTPERTYTYRGRLLDIDTGVLRRHRVLVQRTPVLDVYLALGTGAGQLLDFAFDDRTDRKGGFGSCDAADQAIAEGDLAKAQALGVAAQLAAIDERPLRRLALAEAKLRKASPDDPVRPAWPAGTPGSLGGKFRPKDTSAAAQEATEQKLKRLEGLREFRAAVQVAFVVIRTAPLEGIPGENVVASIAAVVELGRIAIELGNYEHEINQAIEFVHKGPYTLDQLRVDPNDERFSSFGAFKKVSPAAEEIDKRYPMADRGNEYHHIVEQGGDNATNFSAEQLHSTTNIIPLPGPIHDLVTAEYAKEYDKSGKTVREWLQGQSFANQRTEGLNILRGLGFLK